MSVNKQVVGVVAVVEASQAATVTMTSLEIVDFINTERQVVADSGGKKYVELLHKSFLTKVVSVLGEEGQQKFLHTHTHPQNGQSYPIYILPKREATLMAMSYSSIISAAVYDRMTALEEELVKKVTHSIPQTLAAALRLAAEQVEAVEMLQIEVDTKNLVIAIQAPKVEFHDAVTNAENCHDVGEAAKILGWSRNNQSGASAYNHSLVDAVLATRYVSPWSIWHYAVPVNNRHKTKELLALDSILCVLHT